MNRYKKATTAEKKNFTIFATLMVFLGIAIANRELKGDKSRVKYIFNLKKNNPHIHQAEFGTKGGVIDNLRLVVSRPTLKSDFYKALDKLGAKFSYGGVVVHFETTQEDAEALLKKIATLAEASEVIELNAQRTYCDPPAEWVEGNDGRQGIVKKEKPAKKAKETVTEEPVAETPEILNEDDLAAEAAQEDIKAEAS